MTALDDSISRHPAGKGRPDALAEVARLARLLDGVTDVRGVTAWAAKGGMRVELDARTCAAFKGIVRRLDLTSLASQQGATTVHRAGDVGGLQVTHLCVGGTCAIDPMEMRADEIAEAYPPQEEAS